VDTLSKACVGETCWCGAPAVKKVGEEIMFDDPTPARHNLTAYVCAAHYAQMMGAAGAEQVGFTRQQAEARATSVAGEKIRRALQAQEEAEDARDTCECEGEGKWEHCGPCSVRFGQAIVLRRAALSGSDGVTEPFGYWVEQRYAEPVLLRKPAYIPEPSENRKVTPLYLSASTTEAPGEGAGWRTIESAPKDGTEVDLWGRVSGSSHKGYRAPECTWQVLADGPDWYTRGDKGWECLGAIGWEPTHWMPLPAAPRLASQEQSA